jgi:negative regulator of flagellin synthesis FlgM
MAIEIPGHKPTQLSNAKAEAKGQVGSADPASLKQRTGQPSSTDTVTLTDTAAQLKKLETAIANLPIVDTVRVADVKQAINDGRFQIHPQRVAEKLISFESARGGAIS